MFTDVAEGNCQTFSERGIQTKTNCLYSSCSLGYVLTATKYLGAHPNVCPNSNDTLNLEFTEVFVRISMMSHVFVLSNILSHT